jgi:Uma2 family endonuclease
MSTTTKLLTADELFSMPHHGMRLELVKGELRTMSPAGSEHGNVTSRLSWRLAQHIDAHRLGESFGAETGFRIGKNPDTVRAPDFAFVRAERIATTGLPKKFFPGPPDLAVEVMSPDDRVDEVTEKVLDWLSAGCHAVWVVDARMKTVTIYHSSTDIRIVAVEADLADDSVVPGFRCLVADLFPAV